MIIRGTGSGSSSSSEASGWTEIKVGVINYYISVLQNSNFSENMLYKIQEFA